ncbi:sugar phosphate nucleotidyltransferase [Deinococcus sp. NW-56]|uniref:sugar phosphate nucleotidyltransferase n=1 Tax=Deinococcus sp. NW-56 TaxID=2080419 RepID=UPI0018F8B20B|nr:sugar phosphate nucleotidyltransferase [Deinococcus sp. NW-56]
MKAVILAAGRGRRLLPLSAGRPKPALPIAGVSLLARGVRALRAAGVGEIAVVTSPAHETELREATRQEGPLTFLHQHEPRGTGHAALTARDFFAGEAGVVYLGDNLFADPLGPLLSALDGADAVLAVKQVPDPRAYGVATVREGWLTGLHEKPAEPLSDLAACGVFAFQPHVLDEVARLPASERGEIEFPQALARVVAGGGRVRAVPLGGYWADAGTPHDLLTAGAHVLAGLSPRVDGEVEGSTLSGTVVVEAGAEVHGSHVTGPVWIGPGARVRGCVLGPNVSVGPDAVLEGATLRDSLIDEGARVLHPSRPLAHAVIGRRATVTAPTGDGVQLALGDYSVLRV